MKVPSATVLVRQPFPDLRCGVSGQVVQDDVHLQIARNGRVDLLEEPQHVRTGMAFTQVGQHFTGRDVHRCEQIDGAVAPVVMGHRPGPPGLHRQRRLGAVQCLALGLFVKAEHRRSLRRIQVEADDIDKLLLEPRVVADLERVELPRLEVVIGPDLGHRVLANPHLCGQRASAPLGGPVGRPLLVRQTQYLFDRARRQTRFTATPLRDPADPGHTLLGEPRTPAPHRIRIHATPSRDLLVGHTSRRQQQTPGLNHLPMRQ